MDPSHIAVLLKDNYYARHLPAHISMKALGALQEDMKPITEATLDELEFAAQTLSREIKSLNLRLFAMRHLYESAREIGALGSENILHALARYEGAS